MKRISTLLILITFNYSVCSYDAIINLGGDCQVAWQLALNNLRSYALPFDWLITPFDALYKLFQHDFKNYLTKDSLILIHNYVFDKEYGTYLMHDFIAQENFLDNYDEIKAKYERRINRFRHILRGSKKVLFIRKEIRKEEAKNLDQLLQTLYPQLDYTILAMATNDEIKENWNLERVINVYLRQPNPYDWAGDHEAWKEILQQFDIQLTSPSIGFYERKNIIEDDEAATIIALRNADQGVSLP